MEMVKLLLVPLLLKLLFIFGTVGEPCSSADEFQVVNICTEDIKIEDLSNSVIIKADSRKNCTCELSVIIQDKVIPVIIQKFAQKKSSSPSDYGCGLILSFVTRTVRFWEAQCVVDDISISKVITINDVMTIRSLTVNGMLEPNEGYCIEIRKGVDVSSKNKLKLQCGIGRTTASSTTVPIAETTKSSTEKTNPLPLTNTWTTELQSTTSFDSDVPLSTRHTNQQQQDIGTDDTILYVAISATVLGIATVIIVIIIVLYQKRFRILTQCKNRTCSGSNTIYDSLSLPPLVNNANNNTSISNTYSSLDINDFQSSYDNRRLDGSQNIHLSTISSAQENNSEVSDNDRNYENTNQRSTEYANLRF